MESNKSKREVKIICDPVKIHFQGDFCLCEYSLHAFKFPLQTLKFIKKEINLHYLSSLKSIHKLKYITLLSPILLTVLTAFWGIECVNILATTLVSVSGMSLLQKSSKTHQL